MTFSRQRVSSHDIERLYHNVSMNPPDTKTNRDQKTRSTEMPTQRLTGDMDSRGVSGSQEHDRHICAKAIGCIGVVLKLSIALAQSSALVR